MNNETYNIIDANHIMHYACITFRWTPREVIGHIIYILIVIYFIELLFICFAFIFGATKRLGLLSEL